MLIKVKKKRCHMVVFNFQNDETNDRFTKSMLESIMQDYDYVLPATREKSISEFKPKLGKTVLRTVIFVQKDWWSRMGHIWWNEYKSKWYEKIIPKNRGKIIQQNMAGIEQFNKKCNIMDENLLCQLTVISIPTYGKVGIINTNFKNVSTVFTKLRETMNKKIAEYRVKRIVSDTRELKSKEIYPLYKSVYEMTRLKIVKEQSKCLNQVIQKAKEEGVDYLLVGGNLNYRVKLTEKFKSIPALLESLQYQYSKISRRLLAQYEEITAEFSSRAIEPMQEGVDNMGPTFPPTCTLSSARGPGCLINRNLNFNKMGTGRYRNSQLNESCYISNANAMYSAFGWCDRILYNTFNNKSPMKCTYYDSGDIFTGDNIRGNYRSVFGIFEI
jgi:hypothetical protein